MLHADHLRYFKPAEFREWWPDMSPRLLVMLDVLRFKWGKPIRISKDEAALGRFMGDSLSQHNIKRWGEVRAADLHPEGIVDYDSAYGFFLLAVECGFTGVGFYTDWAIPGFHLDVRLDKEPGYPSTWGRVQGSAGPRYVSLNDSLEMIA